MNFLNFFTSGASLFNFGMPSLPINRVVCPPEVAQQTQDDPSQKSEPTDEHKPKKDVGFSLYEQPVQQNLLNNGASVEFFTQQQQLINQYMHMNIQLLSQKLQSLGQSQKPTKVEQVPPLNDEMRSFKKKIKKTNTKCEHHEREHYAKGMCSNCYHKYGRTKKPWNCPHEKLYANGMCQNCYINQYNKKRREEKAENNADSESVELKREQEIN